MTLARRYRRWAARLVAGRAQQSDRGVPRLIEEVIVRAPTCGAERDR